MPYIKIWIHLIFSSKNREPLITKEIKSEIIGHIKSNAKAKDIYIDLINGVKDHIHILLSLESEQNIAKIVQMIKAE
jgi:putative transposase